MKILIILGLIGSGKDVASNHVSKKCGYKICSFGTSGLVGEIAKKEGLEPTRKNLQDIAMIYRKKCGPDYFSKKMVEKIISDRSDRVIVKDARTYDDIRCIKERFGENAIIVRIVSDKKIRFQRLRKRGSERDPKTWEDFEKHESREKELYPMLYSKEQDFVIENNGSLDQLYKNLDNLLKKWE